MSVPVYALIIMDTDMRPRMDAATVALFRDKKDAERALDRQIEEAVEAGFVDETDIDRHHGLGFAASSDGRFFWKIEKRQLSLENHRG